MIKNKIPNDKTFIDELDELQQARWLALFEAINIIADTADETGKNFDTINLKHSALCKYIFENADMIYKSFTKKGMV